MANAPAQADAGVERGELRILEVHADAVPRGARVVVVGRDPLITSLFESMHDLLAAVIGRALAEMIESIGTGTRRTRVPRASHTPLSSPP
mgnify:CR=1 FL=1